MRGDVEVTICVCRPRCTKDPVFRAHRTLKHGSVGQLPLAC